MAIEKTDIKLMEPKRLDDTDAGGGVITGNEILDGVINNMFPNISRLDRTLGRVALAKGFVKIDTATTDQYYGGHMIISEPQSDAGVNVMMVNLADDFDERAEAAGRIQNPYGTDANPTPIPEWSSVSNTGDATVKFQCSIANSLGGLTAGDILSNSGNDYTLDSLSNYTATLTGGIEFSSLTAGSVLANSAGSWEMMTAPQSSSDTYYTYLDWKTLATYSVGASILSFKPESETDLKNVIAPGDLVTAGVVSITASGNMVAAWKTAGYAAGYSGYHLVIPTSDSIVGINVGDAVTHANGPETWEVVNVSYGTVSVVMTSFNVVVSQEVRIGDNIASVSALSQAKANTSISNIIKLEMTIDTPLSFAVPVSQKMTDNSLIVVENLQFSCELKNVSASVQAAAIPSPFAGENVVIDGDLVSLSSVTFDNYAIPYAVYDFVFTSNVPVLTAGTQMGEVSQASTVINFSGVTTLAVNGTLNDSTITVTDTKHPVFPAASRGLDESLVGLSSALLPADSLVNIIQANRVIVIHSTTEEAITNPAVASTTYPLTGTDYQLIELRDQAGVQVNPALYTVDLVAGSVTMAGTIDLSPYTQPLVAHKRYEDMRLVTAVDHATKIVTLGRPLSQPFTAANTFVSSAVVFGDILSSYGSFFDQITWTDVWQDTVIGSNAGGTYNDVAYPVQVTNAGCVTERWALEFTSDTAFNIIGENVGQIGTGVTNAAGGTFTEPLNPETGLPYFKLQQEGWGGGWSTGNVLRFNTIGCNKPVWFIRVTQQGDDTLALTDEFTVQIRGDVN